jgi:RNA polymerase sigma-70 factor, ECF subfamily
MHEAELLHFIDGLYGYALAITRNRADAEDLVQETYAYAIRRNRSLPARTNVKSWLFSILRKIYVNQRRKKPTLSSAFDTAVTVGCPRDPLESYVSKTERERVIDAVQQLPLEYREIVVLREFEDLSFQEIAAILDCSVGTVMSRLRSARSRMRALLSGRRQDSCGGGKSRGPHAQDGLENPDDVN